jgi:hypothetical protein
MEEEKSGRIYMGSQPGTVGIQKWGGDVSYHFVIRSSAAEISNETTHGGNHDKPQRLHGMLRLSRRLFPRLKTDLADAPCADGKVTRCNGTHALRNTTTERSRKKGSKIAWPDLESNEGLAITQYCEEKYYKCARYQLRHRAYTAKPTESLTVKYLRTLSP